jgi:ferredoxin
MGSGVCVMYAAATFSQDRDTKAIVVNPEGDPIESIRVAVEGCPTGALSLIEEGV